MYKRQINGYVDAEIRGIVNGTVSASIDIGAVETEGQPAVTDTATPAPDVPGKEDSDEK